MTDCKLKPIPAACTWLVTVALCLGGCGESPEAGDPGTPVDWDRAEYPLVSGIRDSAGVRIVENARPADDSRLPWRIGAQPMVSIGEATGEDPYLLHRVMDALMLPDQRVVIVNTGTDEIRVYDAEGVYHATWGGSGEGPGEFQYVTGVGLWPGDSILALHTLEGASDGGSPWRGDLFDNTGRPGRSFRTPSGLGFPFEPTIVLADGSVLGRTRIRARGPDGRQPDEGYYRNEAEYDLLRRDGTATVSFGRYPDIEAYSGVFAGMRLTAGMAFGRRVMEAPWGDLLVIGNNDRYELRGYGKGDGSLERIVRREHTLRAPTRAELIEARERSIAARDMPERSIQMFRAAAEEAPLVESYPAFRAILSDPLGHLWVREYDLPGADRPAPIWTVFDADGHALGFVETPTGLSLLEIGEDYLLGHTTDELGIERVQVWELARDGG